MTKPDDDEVVSLVLAIEDCIADDKMGRHGLAFLCSEAARMIRRLRPDLAFKEAAQADT